MIGPNSVYYFLEYMLMHKSAITSHLLDHLEIIVTPMTNAVGYYNGHREELLSAEAQQKTGKHSFDINRDFPYNHPSPSDCLNTIAARIVYQIFAKNNI